MSDPSPSSEVLGRAPQVGDQLGAYYVVRALGAGGNAAVYLARREDGLEVALKVLHPASLDAEDYKRFAREYSALRAMDHPNVVRVVEAGHEGTYPWLALEFVDGPDLGTLIEQWKQHPSPDRFEQVERILLGLCRGLQYVHEQGLIHRDLKPSNVLITPEGEPKITDFGVVKDPHAIGTQLTVAGRLVGTVAFMAPEQITGERVDPRADLYALGAVLYMMLTFTRPIEADSVAGYLARHLTEVPRAPGELDPAVPPRLEAICLRLLMKDPHQRYPSARAVIEALSRGEEEGTAPLRGREAELSAWAARLDALHSGAGGTLALTGPPGAGRTHLLRAMLEEARNRGVAVAFAHGHSADPLRELVESVSSADAPASVEEALEALASRTLDGPLILAVDDLDAMEPALTHALGELLRREVVREARPLLLVYTTQPEDELAAMARGLPASVPGERLDLAPLDRMTTVALVRDRGVLGAAAPVLGSRLHAELGGLPGAVLKQLRTLEEEGWLRRDGADLRAARPLEDLRRARLPVPPDVRQTLEARLAALGPDALELVSVLALLGRPAGAALLARCASNRLDAPRLLDDLVRRELLSRTTESDQEILSFTHLAMATVLVEAMSAPRRRELHLRIARALRGRRRRSASREVATHLEEAGRVDEAAPIFVTAARRAARDGRWSEVLRICTRLHGMLASLPEDSEVRLWTPLLRGEALVADGRWAEAVEPLQRALALSEGAAHSIRTRVLSALGRALHRTGALHRAEPLLREALAHPEDEAFHRVAATRSLADIVLRAGQLDHSEALWTQALTQSTHPDDEARALRGLAHVRALQARLPEAAEHLETAKDLLASESSARVRASILASLIELDQVAGRYGSALNRCDSLLDLIHARELSERLPSVLALTAESQWLAGLSKEAVQTARHALSYARAASGAWDARLRICRLFCEAELWGEASSALPEREILPADRISDPAARFAVLRAWSLGKASPSQAHDLATWALVRTPPLWVASQAQIARDATLALVRAGDPTAARTAAKRGLRVLQVQGSEGLRLELLIALYRALPDPRVQEAVGQLASRVARSLPRRVSEAFRHRTGVRAALTKIP